MLQACHFQSIRFINDHQADTLWFLRCLYLKMMQTARKRKKLSLNDSRGIDNRWCVKQRLAGKGFCGRGMPAVKMLQYRFHSIPVGIVSSRECFANARSAVTETNIPILSAGIAKFRKATIL